MRFFNHHFHKIKKSFKIIVIIIFLLSSSWMNNFFNLFFELFFLRFKRRLKTCKLKLKRCYWYKCTIFSKMLAWKFFIKASKIFVNKLSIKLIFSILVVTIDWWVSNIPLKNHWAFEAFLLVHLQHIVPMPRIYLKIAISKIQKSKQFSRQWCR